VYTSATNPAWAWPTFGVLVCLFLSSYEIREAWSGIVFPMLYALATGVWAGLVAKRTGVQPRLRGMPRRLQHEIYRCWLVGAMVAAALVVVGLNLSFLLAGVLGGVLTAVGGTRYERRCRRLAGQLSGTTSTS
jgi:hypothetical protein